MQQSLKPENRKSGRQLGHSEPPPIFARLGNWRSGRDPGHPLSASVRSGRLQSIPVYSPVSWVTWNRNSVMALHLEMKNGRF
jgi:hypothetical protein